MKEDTSCCFRNTAYTLLTTFYIIISGTFFLCQYECQVILETDTIVEIIFFHTKSRKDFPLGSFHDFSIWLILYVLNRDSSEIVCSQNIS